MLCDYIRLCYLLCRKLFQEEKSMFIGPRDKTTDITDAEELQIIEAFAEAEEYLETGMVDDYYFDTED